MKKKVIFVFRDMGTGGAQKIEAYVANILCKHNYDVYVVNMSSKPCTVNLDEKIPIIDVLYDDVEKQDNKVNKYLEKVCYLLRLRSAILAVKPDLVYAFLSDVVRITVLSLKGTGIPIIGSERGDPNRFTNKQFIAYKKAYSKCAAVVFQLANVKDKYDLSKEIYQVTIPNPCIPRLKNEFSLQRNSEHVIIGAGRLSEQKRFDVLINAFGLIHKQYPEYILRIYGGGPLYEDLQKLINDKHYGNIELIGDVSDVFDSEKHAEMFVLSSDYEGIPNVLLESMGSGIPCISTDCSPGGARFLLKNGEYGLIVPCGDVVALSEAIEMYILNPSIRTKYAEKALESLSNFEPEKIASEWLSVTKVALESNHM